MIIRNNYHFWFVITFLNFTYPVDTKTTLRMRLEGDRAYVESVSGDCSVTEENTAWGFRRKDVFVSETVGVEKPKGALQLYLGKPGKLSGFDILNK